jgi:hypothetical protein
MRPLKPRYLLLAAAALAACNLVVACTADGTPTVDDDSGTPEGDSGGGGGDSSPGTDSTVPNDSGVDSTVPGKDSGEKDTGQKDTSTPDVHEAGPPDTGADMGPPGSPCLVSTGIEQQGCGLCGYQTRVCLAADGGTSGVWGNWGFCQSEVANGCVPGSTGSEACGLCGTRQKICQNDCSYAVGACQNQPPNACEPGSIDFQVGLSCDVGGRSRQCSDGGTSQPGVAACTFGGFGGCYVPEGGASGASLNLSTTVGSKVSGKFTIPTNQASGQLGPFDTCPNASISTTTIANYQFVEVHNPTGMTAKVSVWTGQATGGPLLDTIMAAYNGFNVPTTDTARRACTVGVNDSCNDTTSDPTSCKDSWAGLMNADGNPVTVSPFGSVMIYNAGYYSSTGTDPHAGDYMMFVRTESLQ